MGRQHLHLALAAAGLLALAACGPGRTTTESSVSGTRSGLPEVAVAPVSSLALLPASEQAASTFSASFQVGGEVANPRTYTLDDLRALSSEQVRGVVSVAGRDDAYVFDAVRLFTLINAAGPTISGNGAGHYVRIDGADGSQAIVAWGEISPDFEGKPVAVAFTQDGTPLDDATGFARLVVPGDLRGGRSVASITAITLVRAG